MENTVNSDRPAEDQSAALDSELTSNDVTVEADLAAKQHGDAGNATINSKIMIIDDEQLVIRVVKRFLAAEGYHNFITITDPREATKAVSYTHLTLPTKA